MTWAIIGKVWVVFMLLNVAAVFGFLESAPKELRTRRAFVAAAGIVLLGPVFWIGLVVEAFLFLDREP